MDIVIPIITALVTATLAWVLASMRARLAASRRESELETRSAAAEHVLGELRSRLADRESALASASTELEALRAERAANEIRLDETRKRLEEQERMLAESAARLRDAFSHLAREALAANSEQFIELARKTFDVVNAQSQGELGKKEEAIKALVGPLSESLKRYEAHVLSIEQARQREHGTLGEQLRQLAAANQRLNDETAKLSSALRDPKVRGRWGELALRRAVELAGMVDHCDFEQQVSVSSEDGRFRPDLIVRLPGGKSVIIDAKAVLDAYLDAAAATEEDSRRAHLARHAKQVRSRVEELSAKRYWERFADAPEFVVLFLPGESFFSAAVEADPSLIEDALSRRVVIASPTTLITLLRAVATGWRQQRMAENAERVTTLGREVHERLAKFTEHLTRVGQQLDGAVKSYNQAVGSFEERLSVSVRRLEELGVAGDKEAADLPLVETATRLPRNIP